MHTTTIEINRFAVFHVSIRSGQWGKPPGDSISVVPIITKGVCLSLSVLSLSLSHTQTHTISPDPYDTSSPHSIHLSLSLSPSLSLPLSHTHTISPDPYDSFSPHSIHLSTSLSLSLSDYPNQPIDLSATNRTRKPNTQRVLYLSLLKSMPPFDLSLSGLHLPLPSLPLTLYTVDISFLPLRSGSL